MKTYYYNNGHGNQPFNRKNLNNMKLTKKQWEWLVNAPTRIEVDGEYYAFIQTWDDNGYPVVEMIKYGKQYLKEIFSHDRELTQYFKQELHKVWDAWKKIDIKIVHITTYDVAEPFKDWEVDEIKPSHINHINVPLGTMQKADKVIFHHKGKSIVWKDRNTAE
jgi:hypothetical protein